VTYQHRLLRRDSAKEHILQLFDTADSLASVVSTFLNEGWEQDENLLVIAKPRHWRPIAKRLAKRGCPVADATSAGRLIVLDAQAILPQIIRDGEPNATLVDVVFGDVVRRLTSGGGRLRIYAELVEILAEEGNFESARRLEDLWNALRQQYAFTLLCGYSAAHFADARTAISLRAICAAHTRVQRNASDLLGSWLLEDQRETAADRAARDPDVDLV
jgi:hypothetical protein